MKRTKTAAVLTVFNASKMSAKGRKRITNWLAAVALTLQHEHKQLAKRWTARYLYRP